MANKPSGLREKFLAGLHQGAKASAQQYARELRQRTTEAEQKLWSLLRNRQLKGKKFRRQHAIADYIVDFYCNECKLTIELDENFHTASIQKVFSLIRKAAL